MNPNLISQWLARLLEGAADVFGAGPGAAEPAIDVTALHAKIGELTLANDFGRCARERRRCRMRGIPPKPSRSVAERKAMIDRGHALPLALQAQQLGIRRGSIYYLPRTVSDADLATMRRIDEVHLL